MDGHFQLLSKSTIGMQNCHCWVQRQSPIQLLSKHSTNFFYISIELWLKTSKKKNPKNGTCFFTGNQCSKNIWNVYSDFMPQKSKYKCLRMHNKFPFLLVFWQGCSEPGISQIWSHFQACSRVRHLTLLSLLLFRKNDDK